MNVGLFKQSKKLDVVIACQHDVAGITGLKGDQTIYDAIPPQIVWSGKSLHFAER